MNLDIKKIAEDIASKNAISVPSDKNITLMRNNDTYLKFLDIRNSQTKLIDSGIAKTAIPALFGLVISGIGYAVTRRKSDRLYDQAQFIINEAISDNNK